MKSYIRLDKIISMFFVVMIAILMVGCSRPDDSPKNQTTADPEMVRLSEMRKREIEKLRELNCKVTESPINVECPKPHESHNGLSEAEYENYAKIGASVSTLNEVLNQQYLLNITKGIYTHEDLSNGIRTLCPSAFIPLKVNTDAQITKAFRHRATFANHFNSIDFNNICKTGSTSEIKPALQKAREFQDMIADLMPLLDSKAFDQIIISNTPNLKYGPEGYDYSTASDKGLVVRVNYFAGKSEIANLFRSLDEKDSRYKSREQMDRTLILDNFYHKNVKGLDVKISINKALLKTAKLAELFNSLQEVQTELERSLDALPNTLANTHAPSLKIIVGDDQNVICVKTDFSQTYLLTRSLNDQHPAPVADCLEKIAKIN